MFGVGLFSWMFQRPLEVGAEAPEFRLRDSEGTAWSLTELRGKNVVLVFYPGDETPVCRRQLCEFRDHWELARSRDVVVLGINPASAGRHAAFRAKRGLPFPLLVDEGQKVARLYGASGPVVRRTVYLVGRDGRIRFARRGKPEVEEVLRTAEG